MKNLIAGISLGWLLIGLFLVLLVGIFLLPASSSYPALFKEGGPVEVATVVLYGLVALLFFFAPYEMPKYKWLPGLICLLFAARELDIHERITAGDFLFFPKGFKANYPFEYSMVEIAGIVFVVVVILAMFISYSKKVIENLKARRTHQYMMIMAWVCVGLAILLDGLSGKIHGATGYLLSTQANAIAIMLEETVEFMIPVCFLFGLLQYYKIQFWTKDIRY